MVDLQITETLLTLRFLPPYEAADERAYLDALVRIGEHPAPFELLTVFGGFGKLSAAAEREQALWFKATREQMTRTCRAVAIVRPGTEEKMQETFRKLWSMPLIVVEDEGVARAFLARHATAA
jgi:hypothetical protein